MLKIIFRKFITAAKMRRLLRGAASNAPSEGAIRPAHASARTKKPALFRADLRFHIIMSCENVMRDFHRKRERFRGYADALSQGQKGRSPLSSSESSSSMYSSSPKLSS